MKPLRFYSLSQKKRLWQAGSCISQVSGMYSASVRLSEYTLALETLEKGQVWANRDFIKGYPCIWLVSGKKAVW